MPRGGENHAQGGEKIAQGGEKNFFPPWAILVVRPCIETIDEHVNKKQEARNKKGETET